MLIIISLVTRRRDKEIMTNAPFAALEIGTSKVCALVGELREDGNIMITGMGNCPDFAIRRW